MGLFGKAVPKTAGMKLLVVSVSLVIMDFVYAISAESN